MRVAFAVALLACTSAPPKPVPTAGQPFTLALNETAKVANTPLAVRFVDVKDSRCAKSVRCITAGDAAVTLVIDKAGVIEPAVVHTTTGPKQVTAFDYDIELVSLDPYPEEPAKTPLESYKATLRVTASARP